MEVKVHCFELKAFLAESCWALAQPSRFITPAPAPATTKPSQCP